MAPPLTSSFSLFWKGARWQHLEKRMFISARPAAKLTYYPFPHPPLLVKSSQLKLKVNAAIGLLVNVTRKRKGISTPRSIWTGYRSVGHSDRTAGSNSVNKIPVLSEWSEWKISGFISRLFQSYAFKYGCHSATVCSTTQGDYKLLLDKIFILFYC